MDIEEIMNRLNALNDRIIRNLTEIGSAIEDDEVLNRELRDQMTKKQRKERECEINTSKAYHEGIEDVWKDVTRVIEGIKGELTEVKFENRKFFGKELWVDKKGKEMSLKATVDKEKFYDAGEWNRLLKCVIKGIEDKAFDLCNISVNYSSYFQGICLFVNPDCVEYTVRLKGISVSGKCALKDVYIDEVWEMFCIGEVNVDLEI